MAFDTKGCDMRQTFKFMALCALLTLTLQSGFAQMKKKAPESNFDAEPVKAEDIEFKITDLAMEKADHDESRFPPIPKTKGGKKSTWAMVMLEYEWKLTSKAKKKYSVMADRRYYLDTITFDWSIVIADSTDGKGVQRNKTTGGYNVSETSAVRMARKVNYRDVSDDGKHYAIVFLEPKTLVRYLTRLDAKQFFVRLTVKVGTEEVVRLNSHGQKFALASPADGDKGRRLLEEYIPRKRKTDSSMHLSDRVKLVKGVLLPRDETPWKWSHLGNLETIDTAKKED
jgi:hypothetical protein